MSDFERAPVVVLSSIDWDAAWQRHHIFAARFAAQGHRVLFIENSGFRNPRLADLPRLWSKLLRLARLRAPGRHNTIPAGLTVVPSRLLPPTWRVFRWINETLLVPQLHGLLGSAGLDSDPIVIVYFPTATTLALIDRLAAGVLLYDCASNLRAHPNAPLDFAALERGLLDRVDAVVCDSDFLRAQKSAEHAAVEQIHQGVPEEFFGIGTRPGIYQHACYYGTWGQDLEPELLAAATRAGLKVTVSGFAKGRSLPLPPGVESLPPVPREKLPERLADFEVMLLPYRINPFLLGVVPAKIYECLATGRPIVATPLPSLKALEGLIYIGETPADWERLCRELPNTETAEKRRARIDLAREHSQGREFERFLGVARAHWRQRARTPQPAPWWARKRLQDFVHGFAWK